VPGCSAARATRGTRLVEEPTAARGIDNVGRRKRPTISLFSGALGLDLGLERAGFDLSVAVECNRFAIETIELNRPSLPLIKKRLEDVPTKDILSKARLERGEAFVVTGGPSCQAFSTAGQRGSVADPRGSMFREFLRVVQETRPRFFVMENVRGVLSAAVRHRPLKDRGPGHPPLEPDELLGSALLLILQELEATGYYVVFDLLNAADYGVPQTRERVIFIGSRDGEPVAIPGRTHTETRVNGHPPWVSLREGLRGLKDPDPQYREFSPSKERYLKDIPAGGNWRDLSPARQQRALGGAYNSWGGRTGFFRRLAWSKPAPALTTRPDSKATMFCHPDELRPLTVREYARIQQFPDDWTFAGGLPQQYLQIGNAVPLGLGEAVGYALRDAMRARRRVETGKVVCENEDLIARIERRPTTVLNPQRMRKVSTTSAAREWRAKGPRHRTSLAEFLRGRAGGE